MMDMIFATIAAVTVTGSMVFGYLIMFGVLAGSLLVGIGYVVMPKWFGERVLNSQKNDSQARQLRAG